MTAAAPSQFMRAFVAAEVDRFLAGIAPYFVVSRSDTDEPQNFDAAFDTELLAAWRATRDPAIPVAFLDGLVRLLRSHPDANLAVYVAENWIRCYAYRAWKRQGGQPSAPRDDLFELDLAPAAALLKAAIEANEDSLRQDRRWAGAQWNSPDGLWTPLVRTALFVRDKWGGPDFVPSRIASMPV